MSAFDKQLVNALHTIHKELFGGRIENHCRWYYNSKADIYHCPHTAIFGHDLMARIPDFQNLNSQANEQAWAERDQEHKL